MEQWKSESIIKQAIEILSYYDSLAGQLSRWVGGMIYCMMIQKYCMQSTLQIKVNIINIGLERSDLV